MKLTTPAISSAFLLLACHIQAQSINVALDRNSASSAITIATSAMGYDAADTADGGTSWNNVYNEGGSGSTSLSGIVPASSAVGSYTILNNISLQNSTGSSSGASLSAVFNVGSVNTHAEYNTGSPGGSPSGLMGQAARVYNGSDTVTWTVSGLTAGNLYNLYVYAVGAGANQGASFTLSSTYQAPTGVFSAQTTDGNSGFTSADANIWDGSGNVINGPGSDSANSGNNAYGNTWIELNAMANSSGDLTFTEAKNSSGNDYMNGFQIQAVSAVPEPATYAIFGSGLVALGLLRRLKK